MQHKIKQMDNIAYISAPATNGAMCCPGEITDVEYCTTDTPCPDGTVRMRATDGWAQQIVGRYRPEELPDIATKLLNQSLDAADDMFGAWCRANRR